MSGDPKDIYENYKYGERKPLKIDDDDLTDREKFLLVESEKFCILPWIHLHAFPTGEAYPCCLSDGNLPVGSMRENTMEEIWRGDKMHNIRDNMIKEESCSECSKCYEQESSGFFSMRNSANRSFGHLVKDMNVDDASDLGEFKLRYYDIRFSNLCNLACRSCGDRFSSNWVKENKKMGYLPKDAPNVSYAGRHQMDAWEQLLPHIPYLEEVYFAGGEPLIMEEHYRLIKELISRGRTDVKLIYNTNFSELKFKGESVLDLWNQFDSVSVGASLDASGKRGELMRYGTVWDNVVRNREEMLRVCPDVDFYVSSTLSIMNAFHLPEFHREWVKMGLVESKDWNINILQGPAYYRLDSLPSEMKADVEKMYKDHIEWLKSYDEFGRATRGYESAIKFMNGGDNTHLIPEFIRRTRFLDAAREEKFFYVFPELQGLKNENTAD